MTAIPGVVFGGRVLQARVLRGLPSGLVAQRMGMSGVLSLRAPVSMTQRERSYLTQFAAVVEEFIERVTRVNPLPPVRLPRLRAGESIVNAAAAARDAMGVGDGPVGSVTMAMERAGIAVVMRSAAAQGSIGTDQGGSVESHIGTSAWLGEFADQPLVMMPALWSWERTRWTMAHELGHICLHRGRGRISGGEVEDQADAFAGEFLAPISQLAPELPKQVTLTALIDVKVRWGVDRSVDHAPVTASRGRCGTDRHVAKAALHPQEPGNGPLLGSRRAGR